MKKFFGVMFLIIGIIITISCSSGNTIDKSIESFNKRLEEARSEGLDSGYRY